MGKLNIAHHKSYHPYRRDNIERVRRDEEEARLREAVEEGRMMLADSEARMDLLRQRAGLGGPKGKKAAHGDDRDDLDLGGPGTSSSASSQRAAAAAGALEAKTEVSTLTTANGHINFFEDLERTVIPVHGPGRSTKGPKGTAKAEDEKGVALAPSAKDLNPWYVKSGSRRNGEGDDAVEETDEEKRRRDLQRKSAHDPLTAINSQLAARDAPSSSSSPFASAQKHRQRPMPPPPHARTQGDAKPEVAARLARESSERQRALELIARKKREAARGSETPSTVHGGEGGYGAGAGGRYGGYGDVFNRMEMEEVRRERERKRDKERDRDRDRGWERASGSGSGRDWEDRRRYGGRW